MSVIGKPSSVSICASTPHAIDKLSTKTPSQSKITSCTSCHTTMTILAAAFRRSHERQLAVASLAGSPTSCALRSHKPSASLSSCA